MPPIGAHFAARQCGGGGVRRGIGCSTDPFGTLRQFASSPYDARTAKDWQ